MFVEYPIEKKHKKTADTNADNVPLPIFLIPGILGNSIELNTLAEELDKLSESERQIFIYYDPRITHPRNHHPVLTLEEHGRAIAKEMKKIIGSSTSQYLIVGYSFGCTLASIAAQYLKSKDMDPTVYQIDGASPALSANYFKSNSINATKDLINIINYAARLSGLKPGLFDVEQINNWSRLSFNERFASIEAQLFGFNIKSLTLDPKKELNCKTFLTVAKQNLHNLLNHCYKSEPKFDRLSLLMINETAEKYGVSNGGWNEYTNKVSLINEPALSTETHTSLVQKPENISLLARSIHEFFTTEITPQHVFSNDLLRMLRQYSDKPFFKQVLDETIQSVSPTNSSDDSRSDSTVDTDSEREILPLSTSGACTPAELSDDEENQVPSEYVRNNSRHLLFGNTEQTNKGQTSAPIPIPTSGKGITASLLSNSSTSL